MVEVGEDSLDPAVWPLSVGERPSFTSAGPTTAPTTDRTLVLLGIAASSTTVLAASGTTVPAADYNPGLTAYHHPPLTWTDCRQGTDDETGAALDRAGARRARITVPLDYSRPTGPSTQIALSRLPASDLTHRIGTLVLNHGGPAEPTLGMPLETHT